SVVFIEGIAGCAAQSEPVGDLRALFHSQERVGDGRVRAPVAPATPVREDLATSQRFGLAACPGGDESCCEEFLRHRFSPLHSKAEACPADQDAEEALARQRQGGTWNPLD